jgi:hypothetical protein
LNDLGGSRYSHGRHNPDQPLKGAGTLIRSSCKSTRFGPRLSLCTPRALRAERDALERYWRAVELAGGVRGGWEAAEMPLTVEWPNGTVSEAPLLKLLRAAELDCDRLSRSIPKPAKRPGRKPVAVIEAGVGLSPGTKLRAAK